MSRNEKTLVKKIHAILWILVVVWIIMCFFLLSYIEFWGVILIPIIVYLIVGLFCVKAYLNYLNKEKIALDSKESCKLRIKYWYKVLGISLLIFLGITIILTSIGNLVLSTNIENMINAAQNNPDDLEGLGLVLANFASIGAIIVYAFFLVYTLYNAFVNSIIQLLVIRRIKKFSTNSLVNSTTN